VLIVAGLVLAACSGPQGKPLGEPVVASGVHMTLSRLGGGKLAIERYRGAPVLITMFTTWSLRCQAEASQFVQIHDREGGRGLRVVGIALDDLMRVSLLKTYVGFVGFRFPVLLAEPNNLELVGGLGPTKQVPRTVLLDREGRIVQDHGGQTDFGRLERAIKDLVAPMRAPAATVIGG